MAKVSRKTGSKKAGSSASKGKGLFGKRVDLQSRRVQFFVVVAIFALLGGGWFTVRSFAATGNYTFTTFKGASMYKDPAGTSGNKTAEPYSWLYAKRTYRADQSVKITSSGHYIVCAMTRANNDKNSKNIDIKLLASTGRTPMEHFKSTIHLMNTSKTSSAVGGNDFWRNCTTQTTYIPANTIISLEITPGPAPNSDQQGIAILYAFLEQKSGPSQQISK